MRNTGGDFRSHPTKEIVHIRTQHTDTYYHIRYQLSWRQDLCGPLLRVIPLVAIKVSYQRVAGNLQSVYTCIQYYIRAVPICLRIRLRLLHQNIWKILSRPTRIFWASRRIRTFNEFSRQITDLLSYHFRLYWR